MSKQPEQDRHDVSNTLYCAALGNMVLDYVGRAHPAIISQAMESRAIRTLEAIRRVLEDDELDDPECFERIDALIMLYFRELEVRIDRHNELD